MGRRDGQAKRHRGLAAVWTVWVVSAVLCVSRPGTLRGDAQQDRRTESGLKLFRAMLSADVEIDRKTVDSGKILIVVFFTDDRKRAADLARSFEGHPGALETIRGFPVIVDVAQDPALPGYERRIPAGVFLCQAPDRKGLQTLVQFGIANHVIVYSPFEGHVESGVLGGLAIEAQVRPYLNMATLTASRINLKEFFLKVAKVHR
ncbi:MAG: hypothetical protein DIJKHBIC_02385 [Thermoanaerobaculia bacterium]|nr:hypothetical protein [Thermoanaerobaculia bacterium]